MLIPASLVDSTICDTKLDGVAVITSCILSIVFTGDKLFLSHEIPVQRLLKKIFSSCLFYH